MGRGWVMKEVDDAKDHMNRLWELREVSRVIRSRAGLEKRVGTDTEQSCCLRITSAEAFFLLVRDGFAVLFRPGCGGLNVLPDLEMTDKGLANTSESSSSSYPHGSESKVEKKEEGREYESAGREEGRGWGGVGGGGGDDEGLQFSSEDADTCKQSSYLYHNE